MAIVLVILFQNKKIYTEEEKSNDEIVVYRRNVGLMANKDEIFVYVHNVDLDLLMYVRNLRKHRVYLDESYSHKYELDHELFVDEIQDYNVE